MKKLLIGVAALGVAVVLAAVLLVGNIDKIIKSVLEKTGSELLGTEVRVQAVDMDLKEGSGRISGVSIANPAGYSSERAFEMDLIRLELKLSSLGEQPLVVHELRIQEPVVRLEAREDGSANLKTLLDNIEANSARADEGAVKRKPDPDKASRGEPVRISFRELAVTGVTVHASIPGQEPETVVLPDITMEDVGGTQGLTPAGIGRVIIGEVIAKSLEATLKKKMTEKVKEAAKGLLDDLSRKLKPEKKK